MWATRFNFFKITPQRRFLILLNIYNNMVYNISTTDCIGHCAIGSELSITNDSPGYTWEIYYQSDISNNPIGTPLTATPGMSLNFYWNGTEWTTNRGIVQPAPPHNNLHLLN